MHNRAVSLLGAASLLIACGGQVVFVEDGENGGATGSAAGGSGGFTVSNASSSTSMASDCALLEEQMNAANHEARSCDPLFGGEQCQVLLQDSCGCLARLANPSMPELINNAVAAYAAWVEAGCGPIACDYCCAEFPGGCMETSTGGECGGLALPC